MNTIEPSSTDLAPNGTASTAKPSGTTAKYKQSVQDSAQVDARTESSRSPMDLLKLPKNRSISSSRYSDYNYGLAAELTNQSRIMQSEDNQKVLSTVSLPSLGGRRRVHNDGLLMLDNNFNLKETEHRFSVMENRLKRLQEEEARAERNQRAAEKKAQLMLEARSRHYQDLLGKIQHYEDQQKQRNAQKMKNNFEQKKRRDNILNNREQWMANNHNIKQEKRRQDEQLNQIKKANDEADMGHKKQLWRSIMAQKMGLKKIKDLNSRGNELNLMNQYGERLLQKKTDQDDLAKKIQDMEKREEVLLQQLQQTQTKQRQAYSSLEQMVQVGYNYYSQCYDLKKRKLEELYPSKDTDKAGRPRLAPSHMDPSMVNVKNAEIYLGTGDSRGGARKRGQTSKRKKVGRTLNKNTASSKGDLSQAAPEDNTEPVDAYGTIQK